MAKKPTLAIRFRNDPGVAIIRPGRPVLVVHKGGAEAMGPAHLTKPKDPARLHWATRCGRWYEPDQGIRYDWDTIEPDDRCDQCDYLDRLEKRAARW